MIRVATEGRTLGDAVTVKYYADLQKPYWDQRMVFTTKVNEDAKHDE